MAKASAEAKVSKGIRADLHKLGFLTFKTSDNWRSGIPDIYIVGGMWIETKIIPFIPVGPGKGRGILKFFSMAQTVTMDTLTAQGDQCFAALYWRLDTGTSYFTFMPWWEFRRISLWNLETMLAFSIPMEPPKPTYDMDRFFDRDDAKLYIPEYWWEVRWKQWLEKHYMHFDAELKGGDLTTYHPNFFGLGEDDDSSTPQQEIEAGVLHERRAPVKSHHRK